MKKETIDKIWTKLESIYPGCGDVFELFHGVYPYYGGADYNNPQDPDYWNIECNFLLLVLCAEGESIV